MLQADDRSAPTTASLVRVCKGKDIAMLPEVCAHMFPESSRTFPMYNPDGENAALPACLKVGIQDPGSFPRCEGMQVDLSRDRDCDRILSFDHVRGVAGPSNGGTGVSVAAGAGGSG